MNNEAVFNFSTVQSLFFHKNSIQHMTGYGLYVLNCDNVIVTNCSYYHSTVCDFNNNSSHHYGGVGIVHGTQYSVLPSVLATLQCGSWDHSSFLSVQ